MMHCPYCKSAAHTKSSRYMSEQVKERYHQCTNLDCSCTFKTNESITKVITAPPQPEKIPYHHRHQRENARRWAVMAQHSARFINAAQPLPNQRLFCVYALSF